MYIFNNLHLFIDFGSWVSLVELNLGTNQLARLPGASLSMLCHIIKHYFIPCTVLRMVSFTYLSLLQFL